MGMNMETIFLGVLAFVIIIVDLLNGEIFETLFFIAVAIVACIVKINMETE